MKEKAPVIILLATTLGLGILLVVQHNSAEAHKKTTAALYQKQVNEFEGQVNQLTQNLRSSQKELSEQAEQVGSLAGKLTASETKVIDTGKELGNVAKARDKALEDVAERDTVLKQNRQELLDTKTNVAAVEAKLGGKAKELEQVKTELAANKKNLAQASTKLEDALGKLTEASGELEKKDATLAAALKELEDGQARIAKLETDLQVVNQQVGGLKTQIGTLVQGIEITRKKLAAADGDRAFLLRELKRMQDEKAELEKHLNSLEYVRAQYRKLKSEWAASERLRMIRDGIGFYGKKDPNEKGVANLRKLARRDEKTSGENRADDGTNTDQLNVELKSDGTLTIIQPDETPQLPNPTGNLTPQSGQLDNPKGVVTPASESVLPKLKGNSAPNIKKPSVSPTLEKTKPESRSPRPETPLPAFNSNKPSPSKTEPAATTPVTKPKSEKPTPAPKPAINPGTPVSKPKPAPANP